MEEKKYAFTDETIEYEGHTLHRIKALKAFSNFFHRVEKGDLGGFIEKEANLSQEGQCWVYNDAKVYENSLIYGAAQIFIKAIVYGEAEIGDNALLYGNAIVGNKAQIYGNAVVCDNAFVIDNAQVYGKAKICGHAMIIDNAWISGNAEICGCASVMDMASIYGTAQISGNSKISGVAEICGDAKIESYKDYMVFKNNWSSGRYFTWTKSNDMWNVGCFYGTGKELIEKAYKDSEESGKNYEKCVKFAEDLNN